MDERGSVWFLEILVELLRKPLYTLQLLRRQARCPVRHFSHVQQTVLAEELDPALCPRVRLVEVADERVLLVAVSVGRDAVQRPEKLRGVALGTCGEAAAPVDELHKEERL